PVCWNYVVRKWRIVEWIDDRCKSRKIALQLSGSGNCSAVLQSSALSISLPAKVTEEFISYDRRARGGAVLVEIELLSRRANSVQEEVVRVQLVISKILIGAAVHLIGPRFGDEIDYSARKPSERRIDVVSFDLEFLDGV